MKCNDQRCCSTLRIPVFAIRGNYGNYLKNKKKQKKTIITSADEQSLSSKFSNHEYIDSCRSKEQ
jgi:hypothetical protein